MRFSILTALLPVTALATPLLPRNNENEPICHHLNPQTGGCIRYTKGYDVTGVLTEVDLTHPLIKSACDCIQQCLDRPGTCANYVYKFSTRESVLSGHRTCTLYSNFNLPADVTVQVDLASPNNKNINGAQLTANGNNPQAGALVPRAYKDANLNTVPDPQAVSGPVWFLAGGGVQC